MLLRKKIFQISLIIIVFLVGGLFVVDTISAQVPPEDIPEDPNADNLVVKFNPDDPLSDKLFDVVNFLPGDSVDGSAYVENNSSETKTIAIEAINVHNDIIYADKKFGDALYLTIRENSELTPIFEGTLTEFFDAREFSLSNLDSETSTTYNFFISFDESSDNNYQGKSLEFDVLIGFQGEEGSSTSSGGLPEGLIIKHVEAYYITENSAKVKWWTSYNATSQVVYCKESESCSLDFSTPLYGYNYTTGEEHSPANENGVTYREITIIELQESTTYDFRCISHASPPTVSRGYSFTTLAGDDEKAKQETGDDENDDANGSTLTHPYPSQEGNQEDGASDGSNNDDLEKTGLIPSVSKVFNSANNFIGSVLGLESVNKRDESDDNFKQGEEIESSFRGSYTNVLLSIVLIFLVIVIILYCIYRLNKRMNIKS